MEHGDSLHAQVLDRWGMAIVEGQYAPGSRVALGDAVTGVDASRTVAREATRVLEALGMVTVRRRLGAVVEPADHWNAFDPRVIAWRLRSKDLAAQIHWLAQLRSAVEPMAASLAASNSSPADWAELTRASIELVAHSRQADGPEYLAADSAFHRTLLRASGNPMFAALGRSVEAVLRGRTAGELMPAVAVQSAVRLHVDLAAAVAAGDASAAEAAARAIVQEADDAARAALAHSPS
ncbi:MAG: FCD domain-containing protein [Bifidobacteriaceae bacterium]|jgi:DNA-binding FadR family transcriptional regulator|nr:FCD domain-containing protein [Bifidobacteriaceae bacterium]